MVRKKPYPHNNDILNAMLRVFSKEPFIKPIDFPDKVREELEKEGFYVGLVTTRPVSYTHLTLPTSGGVLYMII